MKPAEGRTWKLIGQKGEKMEGEGRVDGRGADWGGAWEGRQGRVWREGGNDRYWRVMVGNWKGRAERWEKRR